MDKLVKSEKKLEASRPLQTTDSFFAQPDFASAKAFKAASGGILNGGAGSGGAGGGGGGGFASGGLEDERRLGDLFGSFGNAAPQPGQGRTSGRANNESLERERPGLVTATGAIQMQGEDKASNGIVRLSDGDPGSVELSKDSGPAKVENFDIALVSDASSPIVMKGLFEDRNAAGHMWGKEAKPADFDDSSIKAKNEISNSSRAAGRVPSASTASGQAQVEMEGRSRGEADESREVFKAEMDRQLGFVDEEAHRWETGSRGVRSQLKADQPANAFGYIGKTAKALPEIVNGRQQAGSAGKPMESTVQRAQNSVDEETLSFEKDLKVLDFSSRYRTELDPTAPPERQKNAARSERLTQLTSPATQPLSGPVLANSRDFGLLSESLVSQTDDLGVLLESNEGTKRNTLDTNLSLASTLRHEAYVPKKAEIETGVLAADEPFSTFSLNVSDVAFKLARDELAAGRRPDPAGVRIEDFVNAFRYADPLPTPSERVACRIEQSAHPFKQGRDLVRVSMSTAATGRNASQPLHLTLLLDISGSMERIDRRNALYEATRVLSTHLGPNDRVTLIGFARQPRLLAEGLRGNQAAELLHLVTSTPSEGGTNLEAALALASQKAIEQHNLQAINRIVLLTDGAANLGDANPDRLAEQVEALRQRGVAFDACGIGSEELNDAMLETLTRKGDGRYYVLNRPEDADREFASKLAGALRPAAKNVKVQIKFNPERVGRYRLLGYEKHRLAKEDFRNDKVDAAEMAAAEAGVAIYEVEVLPAGSGPIGEVFVRFRDLSRDEMLERSWSIQHKAASRFDLAPNSMQLASCAALLADFLKDGPDTALIDLTELSRRVQALQVHAPHDTRIQDLARMLQQTRDLVK